MSLTAPNWQLHILGAHSFRWNTRAAAPFRSAMRALVTEAEKVLQKEQPSVQLQLRFPDSPRDVLARIESGGPPAFAMVEVSELDEELALLTGHLQGARIPSLYFCQGNSAAVVGRLGIRPADQRVIEYKSFDKLAGSDSPLVRAITQAISPSRIQEELIYDLWFPRDTHTIWIVCPTIHEAGEFATPDSPDYTYLDNLGDTDALLNVMVFLSRYYPRATIEKFSSEDFPAGHEHSNLVVIGGPGSDGEISNRLCRELMSSMNSRVSYSEDCDRMLVAGSSPPELTAEFGTNPAKRRDYGYFSRFPNPYNEDATIVLLSGIHTTGVLGAVHAFGDRRESLRNFHAVHKSSANPRSFECHFEVNALNRSIQVPRIELANIASLGPTEAGCQDSQPLPDQAAFKTSSSVTVLFVAGDRGGSQANQIQTPREVDAIQNALRASKYRDAISLANPILAATRQKLVRAYQTNAGIIHFAGHGDERSLSFIVDQGILVSTTDVISEQLAKILENFPQRVRLCVLNTCQSAAVAEHLVKAKAVDAAIGWNHKVTDVDAISFSEALYGPLGDGMGLQRSFNLAAQAIASDQPPSLFVIEGIDREQSLVSHTE